MNVKKYVENEFVSLEILKNGMIKAAIISPGIEKFNEKYKEMRFVIDVQIKGENKIYQPNKMSINKLSEAWGYDSENWVGKVILLQMSNYNGKDCILATPDIMIMNPTQNIPHQNIPQQNLGSQQYS